MVYFVYKLSFEDTYFYIGMTTDPVRRYMQHCTTDNTIGFVVKKYLNKKVLPTLQILCFFTDKSEALEEEKRMISLSSSSIFLLNLYHNVGYKTLEISLLGVLGNKTKKLPKNYFLAATEVFKTYVRANNLPDYKENIKSDFLLAKNTVSTLSISEQLFLKPHKTSNFRKYLKDLTKHTDLLFTTRVVDDNLVVIRIK